MDESISELVAGLKQRDRRQLARAITLVESDAPRHKEMAEQLLKAIQPLPRAAIRVGISGAPGVGKSTLIETLGLYLLDKGHRVAVLAVDPSSLLSKGSILGDKTRMPNLSKDPRAFIRPSPSRGMLGGVAPGSREVISLLEAAGFDVVIVETVGVGQSEVAVAELVDVFVLLISPGSGDELQGVKKGILELADIVAITKHDGELKTQAERTKHEYRRALRQIPVELVSALKGEGIEALWEKIQTKI